MGEERIEYHLVRFIHILRQLGVRVSLAETLDAFKALLLVDLTNRSQVKLVLKGTLAKGQEPGRIFDRAFDSYFVTWEEKSGRLAEYKQAKELDLQKLEEAEVELVFIDEDGDLEGLDKKLNLTEEQKRAYSKMPEIEQDKLKNFLKSHTEGNDIVAPHNLLERVVQSQLNFWKRRLAMDEEKESKRSDRMLHDILTGNEEIDEILQDVVLNLGEGGILYEDMADIADEDLPKVELLIKKLSRKLATGISRRYKQSHKKQRVDLRKTIRDNMRYGGTLIRLSHKIKKRDKPNIALICDVSGSMARYANFVLHFIYGLSSVVQRIESFIFAEDLERVTPYFQKQHSFIRTMTDIINESKIWGKGTDMAKALDTLRNQHKNLVNQNTVIILVSDGKTLNPQRVSESLGFLSERAKEILWLNTLPQKEWDQIKALELFSKHVIMKECFTLAHLEKIMQQQAKVMY